VAHAVILLNDKNIIKYGSRVLSILNSFL